MEFSGRHGSLQSAAIQRRNEELERILSAAPGVGGNLSVIREGTHEGPTYDSASNTELTSISSVPGGKIQSYNLGHSVSDSQMSGWKLNSTVVLTVAEATSHNSEQRLRNYEENSHQKVEGGSIQMTSLPPKPVSPQTLAIQQKNLELEKQILTLQMKALQVGETLSPHSLGLQQRNDEIERKLAALNSQAANPVVSLMSSATQALNQRNQELERLLAETNTKRAFDAAEKERANKISLRASELEKMMTKAHELDLVFLVDATDSMQFYIDMVKHRVVDIANGIRRVYAQLALRVAFVPYRDYAERVYDDNDVCDFTSSFEGEGSTFIKALTRVRAGGGGDDAEDVFSGLERLTRLSWKAATTRVLVHIGDAPCHGVQFHCGLVGDHYPAGDCWGRNIHSLLKYLQNDCQIASYLFCHINGSTRKMIHEFKRYTTQPGCRPWIEEEQLLSDVDNLVQIVVKNALPHHHAS